MVVLCSPHNPGGRVWSRDELRALADFCVAHDLLLVADEIHHDLVLPGERHVPMPLAAPEIADRLVMLTATTKTFNIAGALTGNVIIADPALRRRFAAAHAAAGTAPNRFGVLDGDRRLRRRRRLARRAPPLPRRQRRGSSTTASPRSPACARCRSRRPTSPGSTSPAPAWTPAEFTARVERDARIAASHGPTFGAGGETFLRFNIGTPRARVAEAVGRLQAAFLQ